MARVWTIAEVLQSESKTVVESVGGTLVDLSPVFRSKPDAAKKWTLQKATITDGTNRLLVKIWNHGELEKRMLQQRLYFSAVQGKRKDLVGCVTDLDTDQKSGVTSLVLKLGDEGEIGFADATAPAQRQPEAAQRQSATAQQQSDLPGNEEPVDFNPVVKPPLPKEPAPRVESKDPKKAWSEFDTELHRFMRAMDRCYDAAMALSARVKTRGYEMTNEQVAKCASTFYMDVMKQGHLGKVPKCDPPQPQSPATPPPPTEPPPTDDAPF